MINVRKTEMAYFINFKSGPINGVSLVHVPQNLTWITILSIKNIISFWFRVLTSNADFLSNGMDRALQPTLIGISI